MKKWIALLLTLCMLLSGTGALAVTYTVTDSSGSADDGAQSVTAMATMNATLYLLYADGHITAMDPVTRTETTLGNVMNSAGYMDAESIQGAIPAETPDLKPVEQIFTEGGKLYGLCAVTGALYTLLDDTGAFAPADTGVTLDTAGFFTADRENRLTLLDCCAMNGSLYCITRDNIAGSTASVASAIDLATGKARTFSTQNLQNLQPYKDGKLIARRYDMSNLTAAASSGSLPATEYGTFDPATDTFTQLGEIKSTGVLGGYAVSGFAYSAGNDTLYYTSGSRIEGVTLSTGESRISAYTGAGMFGDVGGNSQTVYVDGGYYAKGGFSGLTLFALDTDAVKKGALRIFGEFGSEAHLSFTKNYPDIPVEVSSDLQFDIETLANAMVSENDAYDVLLLMMSYMPVQKLIEKGYCIDLSGYPEIMQRVATLDKRFVDGVTVDGKLYGVPVSSSAITYAVNMEHWKELGLTEADLPTTLPELFDFVANYLDDYGDDHPDLQLFDIGGDNLQTILFSLMLDNYITYCQSELGGVTEFDNDVFRGLLDAFEQIDFEALKSNGASDTADYASKKSLFAAYMPVTTFNSYYKDLTPLTLALSADAKPVLGANLSVLVINPKTKRMDEAVKYVCNYLDNLDDSNAIVLHPDDNEPRLDKSIGQQEKAINEALTKQQTLLDTADESEKAGIKDQIKQLQDQLASLEEQRYSVTAEQIQQYRDKISGLMTVCQQSVLYSADKNAQNELNKLVMQYLSGANTQDQFIQEMDKRARMMQLEEQ